MALQEPTSPRICVLGVVGEKVAEGLSCRTVPAGWAVRFITYHTSEQGQRAHDSEKNDFVPLEGTET